MGLPRISSYRLPVREEMPANKVAWTLDVRRAAVLVHDMQRHFVGAFADPTGPDSPVGAASSNIAQLTQCARENDVPVIFTVQPPDQDPAARGLLTDFWGPGLRGKPNALVISELSPQPEDRVLTKWRYNAFIKTPLLDMLVAEGRDQLIVMGIYAHIGCLLTACHAFMSDIQPFFVSDAVADFTREDHLHALAYVAQRCGRVETTQSVLGQLSRARGYQSAGWAQ